MRFTQFQIFKSTFSTNQLWLWGTQFKQKDIISVITLRLFVNQSSTLSTYTVNCYKMLIITLWSSTNVKWTALHNLHQSWKKSNNHMGEGSLNIYYYNSQKKKNCWSHVTREAWVTPPWPQRSPRLPAHSHEYYHHQLPDYHKFSGAPPASEASVTLLLTAPSMSQLTSSVHCTDEGRAGKTSVSTSVGNVSSGCWQLASGAGGGELFQKKHIYCYHRTNIEQTWNNPRNTQ